MNVWMWRDIKPFSTFIIEGHRGDTGTEGGREGKRKGSKLGRAERVDGWFFVCQTHKTPIPAHDQTKAKSQQSQDNLLYFSLVGLNPSVATFINFKQEGTLYSEGLADAGRPVLRTRGRMVGWCFTLLVEILTKTCLKVFPNERLLMFLLHTEESNIIKWKKAIDN